MSNKKTVLAVFGDPDDTLAAANKLQEKGLKIKDVYSPFPIHGIDKALKVQPTRISTIAFFYGMTGTFLALLMMGYMMNVDWPMIIGGKPSFSLIANLPAFIPITFEVTVLVASHLMIATFFWRSRLFPGLPRRNPDPRSTDDKFVMEIVLDDNTGFSKDQIHALIADNTKSEEINDAQLTYKVKS